MTENCFVLIKIITVVTKRNFKDQDKSCAYVKDNPENIPVYISAERKELLSTYKKKRRIKNFLSKDVFSSVFTEIRSKVCINISMHMHDPYLLKPCFK